MGKRIMDTVNSHRNCGNCTKRMRYGRNTCRAFLSSGGNLNGVCIKHKFPRELWLKLKKEIESQKD